MIALSIRVLAVTLFAVLVGLLCRGARPSTRSLIWNSALIACVLVPLGWTMAPRLSVAVPARVASLMATLPARSGDTHVVPALNAAARLQRAANSRYPDAGHSATEVLLIVWLLGVVYFLIRFGFQFHFARRLQRSGTESRHPDISAAFHDAKLALGVRAAVHVRESSQLDIPLVTGVIRPTILLPSYSSEWSREELRIVLMHELAHVRRADIIARATAMIASGLNWFNPLVWLLSEFSARDAELAADDLVLEAGVRPSTYADTLLNIAAGAFHFPYPQPAVPLARPGLLAKRVEAILRESRRNDVGRLTKWTVIACACITAVLSACVSFAPARAAVAADTSIEPGLKARPQEPLLTRGPSAAVKRAPAANATNDSSWIEGAADELIRALADPSPQVRGAAAHSLGNLHVLRAQAALQRLRGDSDKSVQYEVDRALTMISN